MDRNAKTVATYDISAEALAEYFKGIGPRVADIDRALKLAGKSNGARVVEVGCGDGRDAEEIVKRVNWYEGFDPSMGLLKLARHKLPNTSFVLADALTYEYPDNLDVIYAFASLLHISRDDLKKVFEKASVALKKDGIFYISLKERDPYAEEIKKDEFGERMFYYYNVPLVQNIAGASFATEYEDHQKIGNTNWFTLALKKYHPADGGLSTKHTI